MIKLYKREVQTVFGCTRGKPMKRTISSYSETEGALVLRKQKTTLIKTRKNKREAEQLSVLNKGLNYLDFFLLVAHDFSSLTLLPNYCSFTDLTAFYLSIISFSQRNKGNLNRIMLLISSSREKWPNQLPST